MEKEFNINGKDYVFTIEKVNNLQVLSCYYNQNGETFGQWTSEVNQLPKNEDQANTYINELDWCLDTSYLK